MARFQTPKDISCRRFMKMAGGAAGLSVIITMELPPDRGECYTPISLKVMWIQ
jgi:hypothetical protein